MVFRSLRLALACPLNDSSLFICSRTPVRVHSLHHTHTHFPSTTKSLYCHHRHHSFVGAPGWTLTLYLPRWIARGRRQKVSRQRFHTRLRSGETTRPRNAASNDAGCLLRDVATPADEQRRTTAHAIWGRHCDSNPSRRVSTRDRKRRSASCDSPRRRGAHETVLTRRTICATRPASTTYASAESDSKGRCLL